MVCGLIDGVSAKDFLYVGKMLVHCTVALKGCLNNRVMHNI